MFSTKLVLPIDGRAAMMHQVAGLQAGRHLVQLGEAGRHAGHQAAVLLQLAERVEAALHQVGEGMKPAADALVGDLEDALLGAVEDLVGVLGAGVGLLRGCRARW